MAVRVSSRDDERQSSRRGAGGSFGSSKPRAIADFRDPKAQGLAGFLAGIGGMASDFGRGIGNAASDIGDFLASRPQTTKAGSQIFGPDRPKPSSGGRRGFGGTFGEPRVNEENFGSSGSGYQPLSIAEALARALTMLPGGGKVDYNPQRDALRSRASENDARLEAMYRQLQGSYAADAPVIAQAYDDSIASTNTATDQGVSNTNAAYDKARADQTAQLAALGIGDAAAVIAGAGQSSGADQARAVANLEQNRGANVQQLNTSKQAAGAFNTRIGQAAGLEGNLQRAVNQQRLQELLAQIDAQESSENAQLMNSNRSAAMSLAEALVGEDRFNQQYRDSRADADFDKQFQTQKLVQQLQGQTASRFDPQQAISATDAYFEANGIEPTPDEWNKIFGNMIRNYSVGM